MGKTKKSIGGDAEDMETSANNSQLDASSLDAEDKKVNWDTLVARVNRIASPLANRKLAKKLYKLIKKGQGKKCLRKGVREVQKFVRKGEKGLIVFAGDTTPVEVICHMPLVCEESSIPYCYTPSKDDLGAACGSKRPTCMVMVKQHDDYKDLYNECSEGMGALPLPIACA